MKQVTDEFKIKSKGIKQQNLKLTVTEDNSSIVTKQLKYSFNAKLFKTVMQCIEISIKNASELRGKNINFQYGIFVNDSYEYVDMGDYYIKDIEDDKNKEEITVMGYDNMFKFMRTFKQSDLQLTYPCRMSKLVSRMSEVCGVEVYSTDFYNADLLVEEDFFTTQQLTYRDVLEKVAQSTLTTIFIKENKLYLCKIGDNIQTLDTTYLSDLVIEEKFGPVNSLVLGRGSVEDNIESIDQSSINLNGRCEIRFDENEFLDDKRSLVIDNMFQQIKGLEYYQFEAKNLGLMWLEPCDVITLKDRENSKYESIYLSANITINTGISGEMGAEIPDTTTTEYKSTSEEEKRALKIERLAKKNEALIQDIIQHETETSEKLVQQELSLEGLKQEVATKEELTRTVTGTNYDLISECVGGEGYLLDLKIKGNMEFLYPAEDLYPSDDLYPCGDVTLVIDQNPKGNLSNNAIFVTLPIDEPLRKLEDTYDEFVINGGQAKIIRRLGLDSSGNIYKLTTETIENLGEIPLTTFNGENYVYIYEFDDLEYEIRYIIQNEYSELYATKADVNAAIEISEANINMGVNSKLKKYSSTQEMNVAINLAKDSIKEEVSNTYATQDALAEEKSERVQQANQIIQTVESNFETKTGTDEKIEYAKTEIKQTTDNISSEVSKKVGDDEIISKINQSPETVGINSNKIELSANDILNLLAGNEINLGSRKITMTSDKFNLDAEGKLKCSDVEITGGTINLTGDDEIPKFTISNSNNSDIFARIFPSTFRMENKGASIALSTLLGGMLTINPSSGGTSVAIIGNPDDPEMYFQTTDGIVFRADKTGITTPAINGLKPETGEMNYNSNISIVDLNSYSIVANMVQVSFRGYVNTEIENNATILTLPANCAISSEVDIIIGTEYGHETNLFGYTTANSSNLKCGAISAGRWVHVSFTYIKA